MTDSCQTCFFVRQLVENQYQCCVHGPNQVDQAVTGVDRFVPWPRVDPTDWCGEGYNTTTQKYHSPGAVSYGDLSVKSDVSLSTASLTTLTDLSTTLVAGNTYYFNVFIFFTDVGGGNSGGIQVAMNGTVVGSIIYDGWQVDTNTIVGQNQATTLGAIVGAGNTKGTNAVVEIDGSITVTQTGTFNVQAGQNTAGTPPTVVKTGSRMMVRQVQT